MLHAQAAVERSTAEAGAGSNFTVVAAAQGGAGLRVQTRLPTARENLYHAAHRVRAVQPRHRAAHDLDALDGIQRDVVPTGRAQGGRPVAHAVDQQQCVARFQPAQGNRSGFSQAPVAPELHAALGGQQLGQRAASRGLDARSVDDADLGQRLVHALWRARAGDDDRVGGSTVARLSPGLQRPQGNRAGNSGQRHDGARCAGG